MKKCAIVTGAASGIGEAIAKTLSQAGHDVVVADIDTNNGQVVADAVGGLFVEADLSKRESCRKLIAISVERYGRIDVLVNNAGFQTISPIVDFPEDTWDNMQALMLTAPFLLTKYVWPHMQKQHWGRIINIASVHAQVASPNKVAYISAKHGLIGLTKTAALEGGPDGITVNAICPAYVRTPLVENQIAKQATTNNIDECEVIEKIMLKSAAVKRLIEPEEVAGLVLYLCSDTAACVTGASWNIDSGWTAQ